MQNNNNDNVCFIQQKKSMKLGEENNRKYSALIYSLNKNFRENKAKEITSNRRESFMKSNDFLKRLRNAKKQKGSKDFSEKIIPSRFKSRKIESIIMEPIDEMKAIYKDSDKNYLEPKIITKLKEVENCSILKYGIKPSTEEIEYSYCLTCDSNLINPICIACLLQCHNGHRIKENYCKDKILCSCGEKIHTLSNENNSNVIINKCLCNEWNKKSKLFFYYKNKNINNNNNNSCLCMVCYYFCLSKNDTAYRNAYIPVLFNPNNTNDMTFPECSCKNNKLHSHFHYFLSIIEQITKKYYKYEGFNLLHPTQFINMLINSRKSLEYNCKNFIDLSFALQNNDFINSSIFLNLLKIDFYSTKCYIILNCFDNIVSFNKQNNISYYSDELEDFFSFDIIKNLINSLQNSNIKEKSMWVIWERYLKLFHKIYLNNRLQNFAKIKLKDLDNFPVYLRLQLFQKNETNEKKFSDIQEIIPFLIQLLQYINVKTFSFIEELKCACEIISILRKISCFYLINKNDMTKILGEIDKLFVNINSLRNSIKRGSQMTNIEKRNKIIINTINSSSVDMGTNNRKSKSKTTLINVEIKSNNEKLYFVSQKKEVYFKDELHLNHNIIKMLRNFYFCYNDKLIYNILDNSNNKYPNSKDINNDNICFGYMKSDFSRLLYKMTIKIFANIEKFNEYYQNETYESIVYNGAKLIEFSFMRNDSYYISIYNSIRLTDIYDNINSLFVENNTKFNNYDNVYEKYYTENYNLNTLYKNFLNFEMNKEKLLIDYNNSLDKIISGFKNNNTNNKSKLNNNEANRYNKEEINVIIDSNIYFTLSRLFTILNFDLKDNKSDNQEATVAPEADNINNNKINISSVIYNKEQVNKETEKLNIIIPKVFFFYENFIYKSPTNSLLLLSFYIFKNLTKIPLNYGLQNFTLFYQCLQNLTEKQDTILSYNKEYLLRLFNYLEYLHKNNYNNIDTCLLYFLKCFYSLTYEIKQKDFELYIKHVRKVLIKINVLFNLPKRYFKYKEENKNENNTLLEQIFIIYIQLINDCFDYNFDDVKECISNIIKITDVIQYLKHTKASNLVIRTQLLRYARKNLIDMTYDNNSTQIYINSIINIDDNLFSLKTNPLANNYKYPTQLLSFKKDFWNLSIKSTLNEKLAINLDKDISNSQNNSNSVKDNSNNKNEKSLSSNINEWTKVHCFDSQTYDLLMNELTYMKNITKGITIKTKEDLNNLGDYFQYGLLIPIIYYFKKTFSLIHNFSGLEIIKLNNLAIEALFLKLAIADYQMTYIDDLKKNARNKNKKVKNILFNYNFFNLLYNEQKDIINTNLCKNNCNKDKIMNIIKSLRDMKSNCFDYTSLYDIIDSQLFSLINQRNNNDIKDFFSDSINQNENEKENNDNDNKDQKDQKESLTLFQIDKNILSSKIYKIYRLYKENKDISNNDNTSAIFAVLPEICIEHQTNYRTLLLSSLIHYGTLLDINYNESITSIFPFFCLFKLLSLQTDKTQIEIINLLGGATSGNLGFMTPFSQHLMKRLILLFIDDFNPNDKLYNDNYLYAFTLIKIFKFLCEEHNNFFQGKLIKSLNFEYKNYTPIYYNEKAIAANDSHNDRSGLEDVPEDEITKNIKEKKIKFFDFFLFVLLRLMLISGWNNFKDNSNDDNTISNVSLNNYNEYLYNLYSAILEMLTEIIQGNKSEYLCRLGNPFLGEDCSFYDDDIDDNEDDDLEEENESVSFTSMTKRINNNNNFNNTKNSNDDKIQIDNDPFHLFIKEINDILFIDDNNITLLFDIKFDLLQFLTSILEEKNSNEEVQKLIIRYLNINRVFNSISNNLKFYFIQNNCILSSRGGPNDIPINDNNNKNNTNESFKEKLESTIFDHKLLDLCNNIYYKDSDFYQSNEFQLSNILYRYVKLVTVSNKTDEAKKILSEVDKINIESSIIKFQPNIQNILNNNKKEKNSLQQKLNENINNDNDDNKDNDSQNKNDNARNNNRYENNNYNNNNIKMIKKVRNNKRVLINDMSHNNSNSKYFLNSYDESARVAFKKNKPEINTFQNKRKNYYYYKGQEYNLGLENDNENNNNINKNSDNNNEKKAKIELNLIQENMKEYDKEYIERFYIIKFFENITSTVEIWNEDSTSQTVIFTHLPEMIFLSKSSKEEFEQKANRDNETSKKCDLLRYMIYFLEEIYYYKDNQGALSKFISKINFIYVQWFSYLYALCVNLFMLSTISGDNQISINSSDEETDNVYTRHQDEKGVEKLIDNSIHNWSYIYHILIAIYILLNCFFIFVWIYFRLPLYYKIDKIKYMEENTTKKILNIFDKMYIIFYMSIIGRNYISVLLYELLIGVISTMLKRKQIIYAFLLLPIVDLNSTLKNIVISIKLKYKEMLLTFFLGCIIMFTLSCCAFFFFNEDYAQTIEYYEDDNVCKTMKFCFLNALDSGLRARGGIGDSAKRISFSRNKSHYIKRVILDDIFFLLVVIIAIDLIFGIIIGSFSVLRNEEQKHEDDKKNHCFICHANINTLKKYRLNFNEHRNKIHFLWNYVSYMIFVKESDIHDLNAINSYTRDKIDNKDISWIPSYKEFLKNNKINNKNDDSDENNSEGEFMIEDENINKYIAKSF